MSTLLDQEIWNCDELLEFRCPQQWAGLSLTSDPQVRYCNVCEKNVHLCKTPDDFVTNGRLGRCVAIPTELTPSHTSLRIIAGRPSNEEVQRWQQASQECKKWWVIVLGQGQFFTSFASNLALSALQQIMDSKRFRIRSGWQAEEID